MKELTQEEMLNASGGYSWEEAGRVVGGVIGGKYGGGFGAAAGSEAGARVGREIDKDQKDKSNDTGKEKKYREAPDHDSGGLL